MKTLQEMYNEIIASEELKAAFTEAAKGGKALEFLKTQGCETTAEELGAFIAARPNGELSDDELDSVAGGCDDKTGTVICSVLGVGLSCAAAATISAITGQLGSLDGALCG